MNFDFITDEKFKLILTRDFEELNNCLESKASKSVLILSGSIIESILTEYFVNFPPNGFNPKKALNLELATLIDMAYENQLISQSTKELSTVIKNYRNLIHPGREVRKNVKFDYDSAIVAKSLVNIVLREIKENYINSIGHTAVDVVSKLENDSISQPIFEKITSKLHKSEKVKLFNLLVEYDLKELLYQTKLSDPKKYINILKSQVDRETVLSQLMKMVNKVETGVTWEVMVYYFLLYEEIGYLDENNLELVLLYVINVFAEATSDEEETEKNVNKRLFTTFGNYLLTDSIKKEFLNLACKIVSRHQKRDYAYYSAYDQLVNSVDSERKDKVKEVVLKTVSPYLSHKFYKGYNNGDFLPF